MSEMKTRWLGTGVWFLTMLMAGTALGQTLTSDKIDYQPGETATLTGTGFQPEEVVTLQVLHADEIPSTGEDHDTWTVVADASGSFTTTWHVCEDDCVGSLLRAIADGASGSHAEVTFTDNHAAGTGTATVTSNGGSCVAFTSAQSGGPDNWEVAEGASYTMTITGVTECTGSTITVFIQSGSTGNFCFNATGGSGIYSGTFTMPAAACGGYPVSYKCGAGAACNHSGTVRAKGPSGADNLHLRASTFDASCNKTGNDTNCSPTCTPCTITCPADATVECGGSTQPSATGNPGGTCTNATFSDTEEPGNCPTGKTVKTIVREWSASNGCGGSVSCTQRITVEDDTPPTISCPADAALQCGDPSGIDATGEASATDDCGQVTITHSDAPAGGCTERDIDRTWTATDACGNQASCVQHIRFSDTTPPTISCPADVEIRPGDSVDLSAVATASDNCDDVRVDFQDTPTGCNGQDFDRTWTATDSCGNTAACTQRVRFLSTEPAPLTCPGDLTLQCGASSAPTPESSPSDPSATYVDTPAGGCTGRDIDRTWSVIDACGRTASCVQHIRYVDTTPPVISCPADVRLKLGSACTPTQTGTGSAGATDNCGPVKITSSDRIVGGCTGKDIDRTWVAEDDCGNKASCVQHITFDYAGPVVASNNGPICVGQTLRLYATTVSGATYKWTGPNGYTSTSQNPSLSCGTAARSGQYCVTVTKNGCKSPPACTQVVVGVIPVSTITGPASLLQGTTGELCGPVGNYSYAWSNGATGRCITVGPGSYSLRVTDLATRCQSTSCSFTIKSISCACNVGYPDNSKTPRSSLCFTDEPILDTYDPKTCQIQGNWLRAYYDDEAAMILGVRRVIVKTSSTTTTRDFPVSADLGTPGCITTPEFGTTAQTGDFAGTDRYGRPWFPALFVTDLTSSATGRTGDWQQGGIGIAPHKVCGRWKSVVRTLDKRYSPARVTFTLDPDPSRNYADLGVDAEGPSEGTSCLNEGFGAEVAWDLGRLNLVPGRVYRLQFMLQDGNQTQSTGGCDQACVNVLIPVTIGTSSALNTAPSVDAADPDGTEQVDLAPSLPAISVPLDFAFEQNEPNPFPGSTTIRYALPQAADVSLRVYSVLGEEVATLVSDRVAAGQHAFVWHANAGQRPLSPGVYLLRMVARGVDGAEWNATRKAILVR